MLMRELVMRELRRVGGASSILLNMVDRFMVWKLKS